MSVGGKFLILIVAAGVLAGCAARRLPVMPPPPSPDSAVGHIAAHDEQVAAAQAEKDELKLAVQIAWLKCQAHEDKYRQPDCLAWVRLSHRQLGIVDYVPCDPGWTMIEKTCYRYMSETDWALFCLEFGQCTGVQSVIKFGDYLCQYPAKTEP